MDDLMFGADGALPDGYGSGHTTGGAGIPAGYGSGRASGGAGFGAPLIPTGMEAGGNPVTGSGMPAAPRMPVNGPSNSQYQPGRAYPGTPDNGTPSPNFGGASYGAANNPAMLAAGGVFTGSGGWQYQRMMDTSILVVAPASHKGLRLLPNSGGWKAVMYEMSTGKPYPSGGSTSQVAAADAQVAAATGTGTKNAGLANFLNTITGAIKAGTQAPGGSFTPSTRRQPSAMVAPAAAPASFQPASTTPWGLILGGTALAAVLAGGAYYVATRKKGK